MTSAIVHIRILSFAFRLSIFLLLFSYQVNSQLLATPPVAFAPNSARIVRRPVRCRCSPTKRGFSSRVHFFLLRSNTSARRQWRRILHSSRNRAVARRFYYRQVRIIFAKCLREWGHEACVNAADAMRFRTFCMYDRQTDLNVFWNAPRFPRTYVLLRPCDTHNSTMSRPADLSSFSTSAGRTTPKPSITPTPSPSHSVNPDRPPATNPHRNRQKHGSGIVIVSGQPTPTENSAKSRHTNLNEGCVEATLLQGYALQHSRHLWRLVLCARGFCATPHHGIIVNGQYTSMRDMCRRKWQCSEKKTWVNNLKIVRNTYANVRREDGQMIVVTPYDIRFPPILSWIVQITEDIGRLLLMALLLATLCAIYATGVVAMDVLNRNYNATRSVKTAANMYPLSRSCSRLLPMKSKVHARQLPCARLVFVF